MINYYFIVISLLFTFLAINTKRYFLLWIYLPLLLLFAIDLKSGYFKAIYGASGKEERNRTYTGGEILEMIEEIETKSSSSGHLEELKKKIRGED